MNVVTLLGDLGSDVNLDEDRGEKRARFVLLVGQDERREYVPVVAYGRQAETCAQYLSAGRRVALDGRLHFPADGNVDACVIANRVQFLSGPVSA